MNTQQWRWSAVTMLEGDRWRVRHGSVNSLQSFTLHLSPRFGIPHTAGLYYLPALGALQGPGSRSTCPFLDRCGARCANTATTVHGIRCLGRYDVGLASFALRLRLRLTRLQVGRKEGLVYRSRAPHDLVTRWEGVDAMRLAQAVWAH